MAPWPAYTVAGHCVRRYGELARRALLRACCCRIWCCAEHVFEKNLGVVSHKYLINNMSLCLACRYTAQYLKAGSAAQLKCGSVCSVL